MTIYKVLKILNNGEYIEIEERYEPTDFCPQSKSSYTVTLKEGGRMINVIFIII